MTRSEAKLAIWTPDMHELSEVAEAVETVLTAPSGAYHSLDVHQATYLLTTFRSPDQYVGMGAGGAA